MKKAQIINKDGHVWEWDPELEKWVNRCGRIARLLPPGPWWYIALCEEHRWVGMSWKCKQDAETDLGHHRVSVLSENAAHIDCSGSPDV